MDFELTWEQKQLQEAATGFLAGLPSTRDVLEGKGQIEDAAVWQRIAEEQGWQAILVPEAAGGFGFGQEELCLILEQLGRTLVPCPLLGTAFATAVILECGDDAQQAEYLGRIAMGEPAAVAWTGVSVADGQLTGTAAVVDGGLAALIVCVTDAGAYVVEAADCDRSELPHLDPTRALYSVSVSGSGTRLTQDGLAAARARAASFVASEAVGAAEAAMDLAVEYSKVRTQFGKPIGTFQALQHICADMLVHVESARSAALYAAKVVTTDPEAASIAYAMACDALFHCAGQSIQVHGGVGFTWEHDCHLYFKRARAVMDLLGHPRRHRAAVADRLLGAL